jgi:hypothetical protein
MADIGDIRRATSGATQSLRAFQRALAAVKQRAVRAAQIAGREVFKRMYTRFAQGFYANKAGQIVPIAPYGDAWGKRKEQLGLDKRRGVARKGILKTIRSPLAFIKYPSGFSIDLTRPNLTITGRATLGKAMRNLAGKRVIKDKSVVAVGVTRLLTNRRSFAVNSYIGHFADQKAPGLGNIARRDSVYINGQINEAVAQHIGNLKGASKRQLSGKAAALITLRLDRMTA